MTRVGNIVWALAIVGALCLTAGAVAIVGTTVARASATTQDVETGAEYTIEPWPSADALVTEVSRDLPQPDSGNITVVLAARWGYLNNSVAALLGQWRFNDTRTGGEFHGMWRLVDRRVAGELHGRFTLPPSGDGEFRGTWSVGTREGGFLAGSWTRVDDTHGAFEGRWNFTGGRPGGVLSGRWVRLGEPGGGFRGHAIDAPTMSPVDWNGSLNTTDGAVRVLRTVRFERNDRILPRTERQSVAWESTTTLDWDGILFVLRLPRADPGPTVTLKTTQIAFSWTEKELAGLHVQERVDRAGHAIEVAAFVLGRPPARDYARIQIGMRWGNLSSVDGTDSPATTGTNWDGFAQITSGGIAVERTLSFERGDAVLPRDNRVTVEWHSSTTTGWDGLRVVGIVPLSHLGDTYFTLHAGTFTHVFAIGDLLGDHTFDAGNGNQVEVRATRG